MAQELKFAGFSEATREFLWGIKFNNERPWFMEHKQQYIDCVYDPMRALGRQFHEIMERRYALGTTLHVSRIYRDARRLHGGGPYKDHLWLDVRLPSKEWSDVPSFWFEIRPEQCAYGMGVFFDNFDGMQRFREAADKAPERLAEVIGIFNSQSRIELRGEDYKRKKAEKPPEIDAWYNKRMLWFARTVQWGRTTSSPNLPRIMADDLGALIPVYNYFMQFAQETVPHN